MRDLIDRNELLKVLEERKKPNNGGEDGTKERYRYMQWLTDYNAVKEAPTAEPEIIRCKECIYYDPEHIENNGIRYEYKDMPKEAFDELGTGLVNIEYGINVGGRCCRDYNVGYSEDKRVFVPETNYCGRAERRTDED